MNKTTIKTNTRVGTSQKIAVGFLMLSSFLLGLNFLVLVSNNYNIKKPTAHNKPKIVSGQIKFNIDIPSLVEKSLEYQGEKYTRLAFDDGKALYPKEAGQPAIPYTKKFVAIPDQATNIEISYKERGLKNKEDILVYPIPKIEIDQEATNRLKQVDQQYACDCYKPVFYKNHLAYSKNTSSFKSAVSIVDDVYMRSQRLLELEVNPIKYNPKEKDLDIIEDIEVVVSYDINTKVANKDSRIQEESVILKSMVVNPSDIDVTPLVKANSGSVVFLDSSNLMSTTNNFDYLIITHNDFYSSTELDTFANYRATYDNYNVAIATVEDIYAIFPNAEQDQSIRDFVQYAYDNWQGVPSLLLLLGATEWVPTHLVPYDADPAFPMNVDKWFTYLSGDDEVSDMAVGRLSVISVEDIGNIYDKIYHYEHDPIVADSYRDRVVMIDGEDFEFDAIRINLWEKLQDMGLDIIPLHDALEQEVIDNFASNFLGYYNHGDIVGWMLGVNNYFDTYSISNLNNNYQNPFIFSGGCRTANIQEFYPHTRFAENLVREPQIGAVALYGPTAITFGFENGDYIIDVAKDSLEYRAGLNILYSDQIWYDQADNYILQGDPGLHLFGHGSSPNLPDPAISQIDTRFNQENKSVVVTIRNLSPTVASNVPVELYSQINGVYQLQSTEFFNITANSQSSASMPLLDFGELILGSNNIKVVINPDTHPSYVPEAFPFNNILETSINMEGVESVVTILDANRQPVTEAVILEVYDSNGQYLLTVYTDSNGVARFETLVNKRLRLELHRLTQTGAEPGNPDVIDCIADEKEYLIAPVSTSLYLPQSSQFVYKDGEGTEQILRYVTAVDTDGRFICSTISTGLDMDLYIDPNSEVSFISTNQAQFSTEFVNPPLNAYYCADGSCCIDGTREGACSNDAPYYCSLGGEMTENCDICGCPRGLFCSNGGVCITDYIIQD